MIPRILDNTLVSLLVKPYTHKNIKLEKGKNLASLSKRTAVIKYLPPLYINW